MGNNVNTVDYWNGRFSSGDWEAKGGFNQTRAFALAQVGVLGIQKSFSSTICDFGCGAGDAFPVYREHFPHARLIGLDFSEGAINLARQRYGSFAEFLCGDVAAAPAAEIVIASNVLEHVDDDQDVVEQLLKVCAVLFVIVPYKERIVAGGEHIRSYDEHSFDTFKPAGHKVFLSPGWSQYGASLIYNVWFKNLLRSCIGAERVPRARQIMYCFQGKLASESAQAQSLLSSWNASR